MPVLGAVTKQVFTYGKRGRRPVPSSKNFVDSDSDDSNSSVEELSTKPTLVPASKARRETSHITSTSSPKARKLHPARKPIAFTSPRPSSKTVAKALGIEKVRSTSIPQSEPLRLQKSRQVEKPRSDVRQGSAPIVSKTVRIAPASRAPSTGYDVNSNGRDNHAAVHERRGNSSPSTANRTGGSHQSSIRDIKKGKTATESIPQRNSRTTAQTVGGSRIGEAVRKGPPAPAVIGKAATGRNPTSGYTATDPIVLTDSEDEPSIIRPAKRQAARARALTDTSSESDVVSSDSSDSLQKTSRIPQHKYTSLARTKPVVLIRTPWSQPAAEKTSRQDVSFSFGPKLATSTPSRARVSMKRKPRQLTPTISRYVNKSVFPRPPSPPTPSTPADIDLSLDILNLSVDDPPPPGETSKPPAFLVKLLQESNQTSLLDFRSFIDSFPSRLSHMGAYLPKPGASSGNGHGRSSSLRLRKVGEASYSEVFGIGSVVLKIIPLYDEDASDVYDDDNEMPPPSSVSDVLNEIVVTRTMSSVGDGGFVELLDVFIVQGRYPPSLLALWDKFKDLYDSESIRPDNFNSLQTYAIVVLPDCGLDLEAYTFASPSTSGWRQACCIFWQVACILAQAEELVRFEHRDLHWGQILIQDLSDPSLYKTSRHRQNKRTSRGKVSMNDSANGIRVTLIDLGLARMDVTNGKKAKVLFTPFDEETFEGTGDYQFDVYRMMRKHSGGAWENYHPLTNVMWLHYLVTKLLQFKHLRPPTGTRKPTQTLLDGGFPFSERESCDCLVKIEHELGTFLTDVLPNKRTTRKSLAASRQSTIPGKVPLGSDLIRPTCAGDVVSYGVSQGWISDT